MLRDDRLIRCVLFPRCIENGVLSIEALFGMAPVDRDLEAYGMSVALRARFQTVEDVHAYGLRVADSANQRITERKGAALSDEERCHYLGYYEFAYSTALDLVKPRHTIGVTWQPEPNMNEHCDLFVRWNGLEASKQERKRERKSLVTELPHFLVGPERYTHPDAHPLAEHLNKVVLPLPPSMPPRAAVGRDVD